ARHRPEVPPARRAGGGPIGGGTGTPAGGAPEPPASAAVLAHRTRHVLRHEPVGSGAVPGQRQADRPRPARRGTRRSARQGRLPGEGGLMLEVKELRSGYGKGGVLHGIDLKVEERQAVALLGRNGMGKTTLIRSICGLEPPTVTGGTVTLAGEGILGLSNYEIARRGLALVPQGRRVFGTLTVEENLRIGHRPTDGGWDLGKVYELFPRLGERRNQPSGVLSGGKQQRRAIGRALQTNPLLVLEDGPSGVLAAWLRDDVREPLVALQ